MKGGTEGSYRLGLGKAAQDAEYTEAAAAERRTLEWETQLAESAADTAAREARVKAQVEIKMQVLNPKGPKP